MRWRQRLCCGKLETAGKGKGCEAKVARSEAVRNYPHHGLASLRSSHLRSLPSPPGNASNSPNECLTNTLRLWRRQTSNLFMTHSLFHSLPLFYSPPPLSLSLPPTPLRQRRTKAEAEEKQYNLLALICGAHQTMSGLRHGFACPLKALISL